jgi:DNA invertase Pin-like site-specific DNA recombinase
MKKVVLLVRVSTIYQDYTAQTEELIAFVKSDGYLYNQMQIIQDKESATKLSDEERQGLTKMYEGIENPDNKIEAVYVWELSRLSRKPETLYKVRNYLIDRKIDLRTKHENFKLLDSNKNLDTNSNVLLGLYISMCENETATRIERSKRGKIQRAKDGKYIGGFIKYGYSYDKKTKEYIIKESEAEIIRLVYSLYETGKYGYSTLVKELNERGYNININNLHRILTSIEYIGGIRDGYIENKGDKTIHRYNRYYPPIISKEQYEKCRVIGTNNNTNIDKSKTIYYASKLIKCADCGGYLIANKEVVQYRCPSKHSPFIKKKCCGGCGININVIDSLLWHLTKQKEALFIVNQSEKKIIEYQSIISDLKVKINVIDSRYYTFKEEKIKQLRKQIPIGVMNDSQLEILAKKSIGDKEKELEIEKVNFGTEITRLEKLISEINTTISQNVLPPKLYKQINELDKYFELLENHLDIINDDKVIYDLIHKHIKEVNIKRVSDIFNPGKHTKEITVKYFEGNNDIYYYDGKNKIKPNNIYKIYRRYGDFQTSNWEGRELVMTVEDPLIRVPQSFEIKQRFIRKK